jgi:sporulation protein YlmC with PRC-barrel domain
MDMAHYGTLGDYRFNDTEEAASDIRGAKVYGPDDEHLGKIDDVVFDRASGAIVYVVIDTGGWLSSNKFIVPPREVRPSVQHEHDFLVNLTKQQIERLPAYDGKTLTSQDKWEEYERWYRSKWEEDPVMHRAATDRNITPTTKQQVHAGSGTIPAVSGTGTVSSAGTGSPDPGMVSSDGTGLPEDETIEELDQETEITPLHPEVELEASPNLPSYRWSTFEDTLRRRREDVLESSIDNAKRAEREDKTTEQQRRKAS